MKFPDPEVVATHLLETTRQVGLPVNLDQITRLWPDLSVVQESIVREGYLIDLGRRGAEILVRADDSIPRQRFTIAHELGHWFLRSSNRSWGSCATKKRDTDIERWCDRFAAALLMPSQAVLEHLRRTKLRGLIQAIISGPERFQVSHQAFRVRVAELAPVGIYQYSIINGLEPREERFETRHLPLTSVRAIFSKVVEGLKTGRRARIDLHADAGLISVVDILVRSSREIRWLICITLRAPHRPRDVACKGPESIGASQEASTPIAAKRS